MEKRRFGKTGLEVSVLGFGGAPIGFLETERKKVSTILNALLDRGMNLIDTAAMYAGSEEAIGEAVSRRRGDFVLVTKCPDPMNDGDDPWSAESITRSVDRSLARLRTDRIDVVLLHSCGLDVLKRGEALTALLRARDAGKIRFAGYSGDNREAEYATTLRDIAVLETSVSIADRANIRTVLPKAAANDIGVIAKRPIANAAWKKLSEQKGLYTDYAKTYTERLAAMAVTPAELGFAGEPNEVWPEIALRFTLQQTGVHTAIIGTCNPAHAAANVDAAGRGPLPPDAGARLAAAYERAERKSGIAWEAQV